MSILLQDKQDGFFKLYIKGADNVILSRLDESKNDPSFIEETKKFLERASRQGYRTLLVAIRLFDESEVDELVS
jgi:magnesium-transporting ATPase (P-type)